MSCQCSLTKMTSLTRDGTNTAYLYSYPYWCYIVVYWWRTTRPRALDSRHILRNCEPFGRGKRIYKMCNSERGYEGGIVLTTEVSMSIFFFKVMRKILCIWCFEVFWSHINVIKIGSVLCFYNRNYCRWYCRLHRVLNYDEGYITNKQSQERLTSARKI